MAAWKLWMNLHDLYEYYDWSNVISRRYFMTL